MHRFFVSPSSIQQDLVWFTPEQAHQLRSVLRLKSGADVLVLDGEGTCYQVQILSLDNKLAQGRIVSSSVAVGEPAGDLTLCQAMIRGDRFEWTLQKGTELGVTLFQPILTLRTVRLQPGNSKWQRWQRIILEASEQSGRGKPPDLAQPISFEQALSDIRGFALIPTVSAVQPAMQVLKQASWPLTLFIGPEGGFDPAEIDSAQAAGVHPVALGPRTLRTETAAVTLVTLAMAAMGELDLPGPRASV